MQTAHQVDMDVMCAVQAVHKAQFNSLRMAGVQRSASTPVVACPRPPSAVVSSTALRDDNRRPGRKRQRVSTTADSPLRPADDDADGPVYEPSEGHNDDDPDVSHIKYEDGLWEAWYEDDDVINVDEVYLSLFLKPHILHWAKARSGQWIDLDEDIGWGLREVSAKQTAGHLVWTASSSRNFPTRRFFAVCCPQAS